MTTDAPIQAKRIRASERALRVALKVARELGMPVEKLCVTGGQIDIHFGDVEPNQPSPDDGGPEDW